MRNRSAVLLAVGLAVVATVLVYVYLRGRELQLLEQVDMRAAVVATRDIPANSLVEEQMVQVVPVPLKYLQPKTAAGIQDVVGRVTTVPIGSGAQIQATLLSDSAGAALSFDVPRGRRAIAISVSDATGVGGLVRPGNFVDVIGIFEFGRPTGVVGGQVQYADERTEARVLMQNLQVIAVNRRMQRESVEPGPEEGAEAPRRTPSPQSESLQTVTLLVDPVGAQQLVLAQEVGTLTLSLRASLDQTTSDLPNLDPLGLLRVQIPVKKRSAGAPWREIGRGLF